MKKVSYGILGFILAIIVVFFLFNTIPKIIKPDISDNISYLENLDIERDLDLSEVETLVGYQIYPKNIEERLANNNFQYGRSNPMYFIRIQKLEEKPDESSGDKPSSSPSEGYYVYPYGGEVYFQNEARPTKLGTYIKYLNEEYGYVRSGVVKGYDKSSTGMELVVVGDLREKILKSGFLPVKQEYMKVSSEFGVRVDPFNYSRSNTTGESYLPFHTGLDIASSGINGSQVFSMLDGRVKSLSNSNTGYGNLVVVDHGDFDIYYAHLSQIRSDLKVGDPLVGGEEVGKVGSTGRSTGPHLHLEFNFNGVAVNPELFIPKELILRDNYKRPIENPAYEIKTVNDLEEDLKILPIKKEEGPKYPVDFKFDEMTSKIGGRSLWT